MRAAAIILALWFAGLGAAAQFGKASVLYDVLAMRYAAQGGPVGIGLLVSVVGLVGLIFGTTAGLLVARIGPRRAIVAALILGAAVSCVESVLPPYPVMMVARVLEGVSHLAIVVVGPTLIAGVAGQRHQGLAMTLWSSFFGVTYALLALLAPPLIGWGGPQALFLAHAAWLAACAAVLALLLPPDPVTAVGRGLSNLLHQHIEIYASPSIAAPALGFVFYTLIYVALLTLLPPLFPDTLRVTAATSMPLMSIALSLTLGVWLLGHISAVRLVQLGFAIALLGGAGLWVVWGRGGAMLAAALVLSGALGLVQGASFAAIPQLNQSPEDRARAAGAVAQLGNVGTTLGTPLLALLLVQTGHDGIILFVLPLCLCGIAVHAVLTRRRAAA